MISARRGIGQRTGTWIVQDMIFRDRRDAGQRLAQALEKYRGQDVIVLGIPRGGVMTGYPIAEALNGELDVIIVRKLPLPFNPEAGFGAVTDDGSLILNDRIVRAVGLTAEQIDAIAQRVLAEVRRRVQVYRGDHPPPQLTDRTIILVDDGLATGYTMIAAIESVKKKAPRQVVVAVPCSPASTVERVRPLADDFVWLVAPETESFAVASFYEDFHEMSDEEVTSLLARFRTRGQLSSSPHHWRE